MNRTHRPATRSRVTPLKSLLGGTYTPGRTAARPFHRKTSSDSSQTDGSVSADSRGIRDDV